VPNTVDESLLLTNETYGQSTDVSCSDLAPDIGIVGTPVIDGATSTIYLVTKTKTPPTTTLCLRSGFTRSAWWTDRKNSEGQRRSQER